VRGCSGRSEHKGNGIRKGGVGHGGTPLGKGGGGGDSGKKLTERISPHPIKKPDGAVMAGW